MARRASSGVNTSALAIGGLVLVVVIAAAFYLLNRKSEAFPNTELLSMSEFFDGSKMLAGDIYQVSGTISHNEVSPQGGGQVVTLDVSENGQIWPIPVKITQETKKEGLNFGRGKDYVFMVKINTNGVPVAVEVARP